MGIRAIDKTLELAGVSMITEADYNELIRERQDPEAALLIVTDRWNRERKRNKVQG